MLVAGACLALPGPLLAQCAMCRQVVTQSPEAQAFGAELNRAILVLMAAPYLLFSSFAIVLFRHRIGRRLRSWAAFFLPR
jgi:hypothetical protein